MHQPSRRHSEVRSHSSTSPQLQVVRELEVEFFERIGDVPLSEWRALLSPERLFLDPDYLRALEASRPERIGFRYAVWRDDGRVRAVAAFQLLDLTIGQCPGWTEAALNEGEGLLGSLLRRASGAVIGRRAWRVLLCGNVFISGEHGFQADESLNQSLAMEALAGAMEQLAARESSRPDFLLVKEYAPGTCDPLSRAGFLEVPLDACMALRLRPEWRTLEDYAAALNSRCRGHLRRARETGAEVTRRELSALEILARADSLDRLYDAVLSRARVVPSVLDARAFAQFAQALGSRFSLITYEVGDRLVAFNTRFRRGDVLESYHLGLDDEASARYGLYRNTIYDDIEHAIRTGARIVSLGRGAHEVKSSFGAEPVALACAFRHASPLLTRCFSPVSRFMVAPDWTPRRAFRTP